MNTITSNNYRSAKFCSDYDLEVIVSELEKKLTSSHPNAWNIIKEGVGTACMRCSDIRTIKGRKRTALYTLRHFLENPNFKTQLAELARVFIVNSVVGSDTPRGRLIIAEAIASQFLYKDATFTSGSMQAWIWSLQFFISNKFRGLYLGLTIAKKLVKEMYEQVANEAKAVVKEVGETVKKTAETIKEVAKEAVQKTKQVFTNRQQRREFEKARRRDGYEEYDKG